MRRKKRAIDRCFDSKPGGKPHELIEVDCKTHEYIGPYIPGMLTESETVTIDEYCHQGSGVMLHESANGQLDIVDKTNGEVKKTLREADGPFEEPAQNSLYQTMREKYLREGMDASRAARGAALFVDPDYERIAESKARREKQREVLGDARS